jgi:hypothetical protein
MTHTSYSETSTELANDENTSIMRRENLRPSKRKLFNKFPYSFSVLQGKKWSSLKIKNP